MGGYPRTFTSTDKVAKLTSLAVGEAYLSEAHEGLSMDWARILQPSGRPLESQVAF